MYIVSHNNNKMNKTLTSVKQIYKGGKGENITLDLHTWVECGGVEMDYNDDDLKKCSLYGTDKIVRVPFNNKLSAECLPLILEVVSAKMFVAEQYGLAEECVKYWEETTGNCCCRGVIIWKMLREKGYNAKLKIGSLGFIQSNNKDIFYEYG